MNAKPIVKYDPKGESGNIYWIIGSAQRALDSQGKSVNILAEVENDAKSYAHALRIVGKYVQLVEVKE